jgi:hypothetical protein
MNAPVAADKDNLVLREPTPSLVVLILALMALFVPAHASPGGDRLVALFVPAQASAQTAITAGVKGGGTANVDLN